MQIAARSLRQTREIATDSALLESGVSATDYATQLLELASKTSASNRLAIPMAEGLPVGATVTLTTKLSQLSQRGKRDPKAYRTTKQLAIETKTNVKIALPFQ